MPGAQTVPRAETVAAHYGALAAEPTEAREVGIDASYTVKGIEALRNARSHGGAADSWLEGTNGDLWQEFEQTLDKPHLLQLQQKKVPGHASFEKVIDRSLSVEEFLGNVVADAVADAMAARIAPSKEAAKSAWMMQNWVIRIALRISAIELHCRQQGGMSGV